MLVLHIKHCSVEHHPLVTYFVLLSFYTIVCAVYLNVFNK